VHRDARSDWRDEARDLADALDMRVFFALIYSLDPPTGRFWSATSAHARVEVSGAEVPATLASDHRPVVADLVVTRGW